MQNFLMFMGVAFLALIAIVLIAILWALWKLRHAPEPSGVGVKKTLDADVPPFRVALRPLKHHTWEDGSEVALSAAYLRSVGFVEIGNFDVHDTESYVSAWRHPRERIYACLFEDFERGEWAELRTYYKDGSVVTYSSGPNDFLDRPKNNTHCFFFGESTEELHRNFLENRPNKKSRDAAAEGFANRFESYWAREMDWQIAQGGPSAESFHKICSRFGVAPTNEVVESMQDDWRVAINQFREEQLQKKFLEQANLSATAWENLRDRLVFIHDGLSNEELVGIYADSLNWVEEEYDFDVQFEKAEEMADSKKPREAFRLLNESLPAQRRFEWKLRIDQPIVADIYVEPENNS